MRFPFPKSLAAAAALVMTPAPSPAQDDTVESPAAPAAPAPPAAGKPESLEHRVAYFFGTNVGEHLRDNVGLDSLDYDTFLAGLKDVLEGNDLKLTEEEMRDAVTKYRENAAEKAVGKGKEFLAENAKREGVKVTASGLQYEVIKAAEGAKPAATDTVSVHYRGTLISGKEFDSSYGRGEPTEFPVNRVIPGWTEALQLMSVGSKYKLFIPSELAYGPDGAGRDIGPNETLIFEVELLDIKK